MGWRCQQESTEPEHQTQVIYTLNYIHKRELFYTSVILECIPRRNKKKDVKQQTKPFVHNRNRVKNTSDDTNHSHGRTSIEPANRYFISYQSIKSWLVEKFNTDLR